MFTFWKPNSCSICIMVATIKALFQSKDKDKLPSLWTLPEELFKFIWHSDSNMYIPEFLPHQYLECPTLFPLSTHLNPMPRERAWFCPYRQKYTTVGINIWPWVLSFALLQKNIRYNFINLADQFKVSIIRQMLQGKLSLASVARVCLAQHSMAITWDNLHL